MATTRIMPVHPVRGWGAAQTVKHVTDYVRNPAKTEGGLLVTGFECDPDVLTEDFMLSRDEYRFNTGRDQGANEILCYHVRQSFLPGETDAETAAKLGYELAMELTGGNFSFIVCTHTDKPHLHNHIIINAVNIDCYGKFRNELHSYKRIRRTADRISEAHDLSVVDNPNLSKGTANRYEKPTKREGLVELIDEILAMSPPKDFDGLLKQLAKNGCKVKRRGKTVSVCPPDAERYFRFRTGKKGLPEGYDEESLRRKIAGIQAGMPQGIAIDDIENVATDIDTDAPAFVNAFPVEEKDFAPQNDARSSDTVKNSHAEQPAKIQTEPTTNMSHCKKINLIIDIENSIKAQNSPGYEKWAHDFNLQQAAETLLFLQTNNLTDLEALENAVNQTQAEYDALQNRIDNADTRIKEVNTLQRHIGAYNKNREVYSQYLRTKRNPQFRLANEKPSKPLKKRRLILIHWGLKSCQPSKICGQNIPPCPKKSITVIKPERTYTVKFPIYKRRKRTLKLCLELAVKVTSNTQ